ncbi:MAG TPA: beta-ketoacyl synthase N-terminal-like domain-containing protein [Candidatus Sulfotelmatobacter sp.]|jgi:acyl transferase domain-containing protein|nr:beta-ketoacyl synthase N-terminal-like domain-containing protein [Candidatus Sulfotelmatobacter sp.]
MTPDSSTPEGIAIIGMSGRFPGARDLSEFWSNLKNGVESISFFSEPELALSGHPGAAKHPDFVNAAGVLDGIELFDASFFGFNPMEAATLDPQQRLLIECAWHAMEDAGYDPETCQGPVGVYAGGAMSTYLFNLLSNPEHRAVAGDFLVFTGNDKDFLTTRVSYKLNLKGPSIAVQTACSTSLVAIAMACDSLLNHQCDMALAGGVAIRVPQKSGYVWQEGQIFSRDGHTRSFDAEASGTLFSNGVGLVVLKRLEDAIADRDNIRAVIKGTAVNNDGSAKVGYAAPGLDAQAEVVAMAHAMAGIDPRTVSYVEAHGTATPMGDSIEVAALSKAFRVNTDEKNFCALGSVKSNVGHLDTASGVAALIKTVLSLERGAIPASINFTRPNPKIDFKNSPFYVNTELQPWPSGNTPRRAGVHSFGIGGTNAHVVLEEAPVVDGCTSLRSYHLLLLSARSKSALQAAAANFAAHFQQHPDLNLADVAYTCQVGRREFVQRQILVCRNSEDAAGALREVDGRRVLRGTKPPTERSLAFLFPGYGVKYVGIGSELYKSGPTFRKSVDDCLELLRDRLGFDLRSLLYSAGDQTEQTGRLLDSRRDAGATISQKLINAEVGELALFVLEYALAQLWMEWGVKPQVMMGQGVGEYVAACLADVFSLEDALRLLSGRVSSSRAEEAAKIRLRAPKIPFVSNLTGTWITASAATDPQYWAAPARQPKRIEEGLDCLMGASNRTLLEVGPGGAFVKLMREHVELTDHAVLQSLPCADEQESDTESMLNALGRLWLLGAKIDWSGFWRHEKRRRVALPTYAFDRKRYWVEPKMQFSSGKTFSNPAQDKSAAQDTESVCCETSAVSADRDNFYAAPTDDVEMGIVKIWQHLLGVEQVGLYDNFFALGGHSMLGAQLLASLRSVFHVEIPLPSLFEVPTVAGMAERIRAFR